MYKWTKSKGTTCFIDTFSNVLKGGVAVSGKAVLEMHRLFDIQKSSQHIWELTSEAHLKVQAYHLTPKEQSPTKKFVASDVIPYRGMVFGQLDSQLPAIPAVVPQAAATLGISATSKYEKWFDIALDIASIAAVVLFFSRLGKSG